MGIFVKNLGGKKALRLRLIFLVCSLIVICIPLKNARPQVVMVVQAVATTAPTTTEPTTLPTTTEPETTKQAPYVAMSITSVQNDIRIKFYDRNMKLYTGYEFQIVVKYPDGTKKEFSDENMDGKLNINKLKAGKYNVEMILPDLFEFLKSDLDVTVKDKVEYKPIKDIKEDIQKEDPKQETPRAPVVVEQVLTDTVELLESHANTYTEYQKVENSTVEAPVVEEPEEGSGPESSEPEASSSEPSTTVSPSNEPLLDKSKNQLYIKDGTSYKVATLVDYKADGEYYKQIKVTKYTGWQTINGKRYYYDKNNNYVTGNQIINKTKYSFGGDGVLLPGSGIMGIDVSRWQGTINWQSVKNSGVQFVILRCGGRYYGGGGLYIDSNFDSYIKGAKAVGLKVGVYFFSAAINEAEAVEEASAALANIKGAKLDYPIFIDIEYGNSDHTGRADANSKATWTSIAKAFCETVRSKGYKAGIYADKNHMENLLDMSTLNKYTIWVAQYNSTCTYKGKYDMWQNTSSGNVFGINGGVDMDISYIY